MKEFGTAAPRFTAFWTGTAEPPKVVEVTVIIDLVVVVVDGTLERYDSGRLGMFGLENPMDGLLPVFLVVEESIENPIVH